MIFCVDCPPAPQKAIIREARLQEKLEEMHQEREKEKEEEEHVRRELLVSQQQLRMKVSLPPSLFLAFFLCAC